MKRGGGGGYQNQRTTEPVHALERSRIWGLVFGVWGLEFWVWGLGFEVCGLWFGFWGLWFGFWGLGSGVRGLGFGVYGVWFMVYVLWSMVCGSGFMVYDLGLRGLRFRIYGVRLEVWGLGSRGRVRVNAHLQIAPNLLDFLVERQEQPRENDLISSGFSIKSFLAMKFTTRIL